MSHGTSTPPDSDRAGRLRARAEARLRESRSNVRPLDGRAIVVRLAERGEDDTVERVAPGAGIAAHALGVRDRVITVKPAPNAPLLMRIVRTPYAHTPASGKRILLIERAPTERLEPLGRPGVAWTSCRPGGLFRSPLRSVEHGLPARPRPRRPAEGGAA